MGTSRRRNSSIRNNSSASVVKQIERVHPGRALVDAQLQIERSLSFETLDVGRELRDNLQGPLVLARTSRSTPVDGVVHDVRHIEREERIVRGRRR